MDETAVDRLVAETRRHFDEVAAGLRSDVRTEMQQFRAETRHDVAELHRHFDVVAEGLRSEIQLVAEGLGTLTSRFERFQVDVKEEFREVRSMIKLSYTELDRRLTGLETSVHSLESRVERLEKTA